MTSDQQNDQPAEDHPEPSASAIFVAMMRQAAAKTASQVSKSDDAALPGVDSETSANPARAAEKHQIRRIRPRLALPAPRSSSAAGAFFGTLFVVLVSTSLVATLLMFFVNPQFLNPAAVQGLPLDSAEIIAGAAAPGATAVQTPQWLKRIGIISGHRGKDSGAVCKDEYGRVTLKEVDINFDVTTRVVEQLKAENYAVDMLDELDPRLDNYRAAALVSIHANTCLDYGELVTGYIVHKAEARPEVGIDAFLRECVAVNYGAHVPLARSYTETEDLINYHAFRKIHPLTPAVILEMGYMLADQQVLTEDPDRLAYAVIAGVRCFMENADASSTGLGTMTQSERYLVPTLATPTPAFRR